MIIEKNKVASFYYRLNDENGAQIENNFDSDPMAYLHGHGNIFPALEAGLEGLSEGDEKNVALPPEGAYGARRDNATQKVPVKHLVGKHKKLLPGMMVKVNTEKGAVDGTVVKAGKFMVQVDFNHPLAGQTIEFVVKIAAIREATENEIAHGHAHGVGGHNH